MTLRTVRYHFVEQKKKKKRMKIQKCKNSDNLNRLFIPVDKIERNKKKKNIEKG